MSTPPRIALVTGTSSGIGRATALALHAAGFTTYASARRTDALGELEVLGLRTITLDVTDEVSMQTALRRIEAEAGQVAVLVNNAGYGLNGPLEEVVMSEVRREFETNVFGLLRLSQLVLPGMRQHQWGRVINIGSVGGSFTAPGAGAYHASKYAVESISDAMRYEVAEFGVDVVLIKPTGVYTSFDSKLAASSIPATDVPTTEGGSPYQAFKAQHASVTAQMFDRTKRNVAGIIEPEAVAQVVVRAAVARRPKTRYVVGLSGHTYLALRRILPDRAWDKLMAVQFPMHRSVGRGA